LLSWIDDGYVVFGERRYIACANASYGCVVSIDLLFVSSDAGIVWPCRRSPTPTQRTAPQRGRLARTETNFLATGLQLGQTRSPTAQRIEGAKKYGETPAPAVRHHSLKFLQYCEQYVY